MNLNRLLVMAFVVLALPVATGSAESTLSPTPDQAEAVKGNNAFAMELYKQLYDQPGNLFFSPESISMALAMAYAGARGETAAEMGNVLHFTLSPEKLHPTMGGLLGDLNAAHDGYQLKVANALWGQQGYTFLDNFLMLTKDNYGAGLNHVDFKGATEASRQAINQWVEQQTENKIKDLLAPGVLKPETRLVLTNAIYFKGDWQTQFKKEDTKDEDFHVSAAQTVKAPLMHRQDNFNYYDGGTFKALEIPYKNKELSMVVFLPKDSNGLAPFEQTLTADNTQQWLGRLQAYHEVVVTLPKFKIEMNVGLNDTLQAMGMRQAFDKKNADFSGMASKETMQHDGNFYISAVIHKAYVAVDEEGTEAAATTAVVGETRPTIEMLTPSPAILRADHPFLFLIRDNRSGGILFMGRVSDPTK